MCQAGKEAMVQDNIEIPQAWEELAWEQLRGTLMVIGETDTGKSTFARYLYQRLCRKRPERMAYLDGDPGQSRLGPPTTLTLAVGKTGPTDFPPQGKLWRSFVGGVSPKGHMLEMAVGLSRLTEGAHRAGVTTIVYDTSGLIDPSAGGTALKWAKIELLRPQVLFAIQKGNELEPLLRPLRRSRRVQVVELRPASAVVPRDMLTRQAYRAAQFAQYFEAARPLHLKWSRLAVFPQPKFALHQLISLEDSRGYLLALGQLQHSDPDAKQVTLLTPLASLKGVDALRLGDITLDPQTFQHQRLLEG
jgi:polynucleotide 5'-hydroxyl-kinase GRC3/NOL9